MVAHLKCHAGVTDATYKKGTIEVRSEASRGFDIAEVLRSVRDEGLQPIKRIEATIRGPRGDNVYRALRNAVTNGRSCRRTAPPVLGPKSACHGSRPCGPAPSGAPATLSLRSVTLNSGYALEVVASAICASQALPLGRLQRTGW